jgi:1-acyl-sn-glycerol-3-phosphate acyltransferase
MRRISQLLYGGFACLTFTAVVCPTLLLLAVTPGLRHRRLVAKYAAGLIFWTWGSPIKVHGAQKLNGSAAVVVANHTSYLDGIILTAALPGGFTFIIKKEMNSVPLAGWLLRRLGSEFVDRNDPQQRTRAARRLLRAAEAQTPLVFFPEGTFDHEVGLKRFRPGAFRAARRAGVPLIPIAIHGARQKLPGDRRLPQLGSLQVDILDALETTIYVDAAALAEDARRVILEVIDEPDRLAD